MSPPSGEEKELLGEDEIEEGIRLACRSRIEKDLVIQVEETDWRGLITRFLQLEPDRFSSLTLS